ncbi:winged helix-turn-helix domain-containing protein [Streptosporangium sp. NPDC020072]|uniref:winged helix-turn-helix domain-containing protein n=1 Tax=Streptosporangium sp. NPDC020072 TaxID=3154788 RepID=UPI00342B14F4
MPIDPDSYEPLYRQVAGDLRQRITSGALSPGQRLPAEPDLAHEYGVGIDALRDALAVLRSEGLVRTVSREGSYVREEVEPAIVRIEGSARIRVRLPTLQERKRLRLAEGMPVLVVNDGEGTRLLSAYDTEIEIS